MRVLFLSRADVFDGTSSMVTIPTSKFADIMEIDPTFFVLWVVPRGTKDEAWKKFVLDRVPDPDRIIPVKVMANVFGRTLGYFSTEDLWTILNQAKTHHAYDVVVTNQLPMTPIYSVLLRNRYSSSRYNVDVPMINWHMWTATFRQMLEVPEYYAGEEDVIAESLSSLYCTNVWESEYLYASHLETMSRWVNEAALDRIRRQSLVIPQGVDTDRFGAPRALRARRLRQAPQVDDQPPGLPRLFWGGRLANQKKPKVTFPLMEAVRQATGAEVVVSTPHDSTKGAWVTEQFPEWTVHFDVESWRFAELTAEGDVFLCNGVSEGYGVGWLEMLSVGMLGVFKDEWWVRRLLPDWYPYIVSTEAEQLPLATALIRSWPDGQPWREVAPRVQAWIEEEHNAIRTSEALYKVLAGEHEKALVGARGRGSIAKLAVQAAYSARNGDGPVTIEQVTAKMTELGSGRQFGKVGDMISRAFIRRALQANGWVDLSRSTTVELVPPR